MNYQALYIVGALVFGFLIGLIVEMICDNEIVFQLRKENGRLRDELAKAKKEPEVIEIVDKRQAPDEITFPNTTGF